MILSTPTASTVSLAVLVLLLVAAAVIDYRSFRIPNRLTGTGLVLGLALGAIASGLDGFLSALGGAAAGMALLLPMYILRVMGAGDVKLMAAAGSFLGLSQIVPAVLAVFITGGVAALVFVVAHRCVPRLAANLKHVVQGAVLSVITGQAVPGMTPAMSVGRLPYGMSISAGILFYLAARQLGYL